PGGAIPISAIAGGAACGRAARGISSWCAIRRLAILRRLIVRRPLRAIAGLSRYELCQLCGAVQQIRNDLPQDLGDLAETLGRIGAFASTLNTRIIWRLLTIRVSR